MADDQMTPPERDQLGDPLVHNQGEPIIQVEIEDDVDATIDGVTVLPGETAWVDGGCAIHLVSVGHARIVGSRDPETAKKDRLKREAAAARAAKAPKQADYAPFELRIRAADKKAAAK